jgi:hypothetical protein
MIDGAIVMRGATANQCGRQTSHGGVERNSHPAGHSGVNPPVSQVPR